MIFVEKIELKIYVNQHDFVQIYKLLHVHDFVCVFFMNYECVLQVVGIIFVRKR